MVVHKIKSDKIVTKKEKSLKKIALSERSYSEPQLEASIVNNNPGPVIKTDYTGKIVYINPASVVVLGKRLLGKSIFTLLPELKKSHLKKITASKAFQLETSVNSKEYQFLIVKDTQMKSFYFYGVDITERKQAEEYLKKSEKSLLRAQEISQSGSWEWDIESDKGMWSDQIYDIFGYKPGEIDITFEWLLKHIHTDDRGRVANGIELSVTNQSPINMEYRILRKDGIVRNIHLKAEVLADGSGKPIGMTGIIQDITERQVADQQFRDLLESAPDGMVITDESGKIVRINTQTEKIFGFGRDELIGKKVEKLIAKIFHGKHKKHRKHYHSDPSIRPMGVAVELMGLHKDGHDIPIEITLGPLETPGGMLFIAGVRDISDKQQMANKLKGTLSTLKSVMDNSDDSIYVVDNDMKPVYYNDNFLNLVEVNADLMNIVEFDKRIKTIIHLFKDPKGFKKRIQYFMENPQEKGTDILELNNGKIYERYTSPHISNGNIVGRIWSFKDITEREEGEKNLKARTIQQAAVADLGLMALERTGLNSLMDRAVNVIADTLNVDYSKVLELQNNGGKLLLRAGIGWNKGLVGRAVVSSRDNNSQAAYTLQSNKPVIVIDLKTDKRFKGPALLTDHQVVSGLSVIIKGSDEIYGVLGAHTMGKRKFSKDDVNFMQSIANIIATAIEHQNSLHALEVSEQKYRSFVENADDAIYILQDRKFVLVNPAFEKLLGYTQQETVADEFDSMEIIAPESRELALQRQGARDKGDEIPSIYEMKGLTRSGEIIDLQMSTVSIEYKGRPAVQGIMRNVTEIKRFEAMQLEFNEKLVQTQRMESLGLLAGGVAHDLNNIIGPIMAYPDIIEMDLADGKSVKEDLDIIRSSVQRAADVISDLLALTRRGKYKMESIDLNDLIGGYLNSAEYKSIRNRYPKVKLSIQLSVNAALIKGSNAHLPKVLVNLFNNAFESMTKGGMLSITTSTIDIKDEEYSKKNIPSGRYHLLTIEDQGEGISKEDISRIFDPFFTTKSKSGKSGTGLGLSVVYNVLKDHGVDVNVESKLGMGTKFNIYFPETTEEREMASDVLLKGRGSGSILVVDDRKEQRDIARRLLTTLGYDIETVSTGQDAVEYVKNKDVDLVFLDMILEADMDGLDTYREIIKIKPEQKTIIVSGYSESDRMKEAERLGVNGFMQKPYKISDIKKTMQTVFDNSKFILRFDQK